MHKKLLKKVFNYIKWHKKVTVVHSRYMHQPYKKVFNYIKWYQKNSKYYMMLYNILSSITKCAIQLYKKVSRFIWNTIKSSNEASELAGAPATKVLVANAWLANIDATELSLINGQLMLPILGLLLLPILGLLVLLALLDLPLKGLLLMMMVFLIIELFYSIVGPSCIFRDIVASNIIISSWVGSNILLLRCHTWSSYTLKI